MTLPTRSCRAPPLAPPGGFQQNAPERWGIFIAGNCLSPGAGSGKTYRLTEKLAEALKGGLDPEEVLATTFTNKAAAELTERVRTSLLGRGEW